jgi:translocation and assembly module TamB
VRGTLDPVGVQNLDVQLDSVPLRGFAEFAGVRQLDGSLDGHVAVRGPASNVTAVASLGVVLGDVRGAVNVELRENGQLFLDTRLADVNGHPLSVRGTVPYQLSIDASRPAPSRPDAALALDIRADSFSVAWLTPFARPAGVEGLAGYVTAAVGVSGTFSTPALSGSARIAGGSLDMPQTGVAYRAIAGELGFSEDRIHIASLRASAGGSATLQGDITLETAREPAFNLTVHMDRFRAVTNEWTRLTADGSLDLTGTLARPMVTGDVKLLDTDFFADLAGQESGVRPVELTDEDYRMLESYFGYRSAASVAGSRDYFTPMGMKLALTLGADVWLRRRTAPALRLQLDGSLDVRKTPGDSLELFGTIETLSERSYFEEFNRRFSVTRGSATFNGSVMGWRANVQAQYAVPSHDDPSASEVVITIDVKGGLDDLELTLGSQPSMETADILSYLATGKPAASAAAFGGSGDSKGIVGAASTLAVGQLARVLEQSAADNIGLDVVEIRQDGLRGATLVAGRYVSPRLFVGFQQPLTFRPEDAQAGQGRFQATEIELEYTAYRWLLLNLQGGQSNFRFFFRTKYAY